MTNSGHCAHREKLQTFTSAGIETMAAHRVIPRWQLLYFGLVAGLLLHARLAIATSLRTVAVSGEAAPGTGTGVVFAPNFGIPVLDNAGQAVFQAKLAGNGVTTTNDAGIWSEGSGALTLIARSGSAAPGVPTGVTFSNFDPPAINASGKAAFFANLTGAGVTNQNNFGAWSQGLGS